MNKLRFADYRKEWLNIYPGILKALEHQKEGIMPEDVFAALKARSATLMVSDDGFVIFKDYPTEDGKDLLVWMAFNSKGSAIEEFTDEVDQLARENGYLGIQFVSDRRGFERALPDGWELMHYRWRRPLK